MAKLSDAQECYVRFAPTVHAIVAEALERARVVGTLDEWENAERGRRIEITPWSAGGYFAVFYGTFRGAENTELHNAPLEAAPTRDAARAAAAKAIEEGKV
jgi:hypothetical protein